MLSVRIRAHDVDRKGFEMGETAESRATVSDRIRAIEDRLEIYNLIAGHPPSADTGADYYAETVYAEDGVFDRGEDLTGAAGGKKIAAMLQSPGHQAAISGGLAHFAGLPHIELNGDTATVTSYLQIIHPHPTAEKSSWSITGLREAIESIAWWPRAGNSFAPTRVGGSSAAPCDRSTAANPPARC
jgi:hypothetical protein